MFAAAQREMRFREYVMFAHERTIKAVDALARDATDQQIAGALADYFLVGKLAPVTASINHNAKASPCPVLITRPGAKSSGVTHHNLAVARTWIVEALIRGYEVSCTTMHGHETRSIAKVRSSIDHAERMAAYRAKRALEPKADYDDEIPF